MREAWQGSLSSKVVWAPGDGRCGCRRTVPAGRTHVRLTESSQSVRERGAAAPSAGDGCRAPGDSARNQARVGTTPACTVGGCNVIPQCTPIAACGLPFPSGHTAHPAQSERSGEWVLSLCVDIAGAASAAVAGETCRARRATRTSPMTAHMPRRRAWRRGLVVPDEGMTPSGCHGNRVSLPSLLTGKTSGRWGGVNTPVGYSANQGDLWPWTRPELVCIRRYCGGGCCRCCSRRW